MRSAYIGLGVIAFLGLVIGSMRIGSADCALQTPEFFVWDNFGEYGDEFTANIFGRAEFVQRVQWCSEADPPFLGAIEFVSGDSDNVTNVSYTPDLFYPNGPGIDSLEIEVGVNLVSGNSDGLLTSYGYVYGPPLVDDEKEVAIHCYYCN